MADGALPASEVPEDEEIDTTAGRSTSTGFLEDSTTGSIEIGEAEPVNSNKGGASGTSGSSSSAAVAAGVVGGVALVCCVALVAAVIMRRRSRKQLGRHSEFEWDPIQENAESKAQRAAAELAASDAVTLADA